MTYLLLALGFLATATAVAVVARGATGHRTRPGPVAGRAVVLAAVALLLLTAVFDTVMIASGLFAYSDAHISGPRIGLAPIEDFAYPLAAVMLLPALWTYLGSRRDR